MMKVYETNCEEMNTATAEWKELAHLLKQALKRASEGASLFQYGSSACQIGDATERLNDYIWHSVCSV